MLSEEMSMHMQSAKSCYNSKVFLASVKRVKVSLKVDKDAILEEHQLTQSSNKVYQQCLDGICGVDNENDEYYVEV